MRVDAHTQRTILGHGIAQTQTEIRTLGTHLFTTEATYHYSRLSNSNSCWE